MKYTASHLTVYHTYFIQYIGRLSETAKKKVSHLKCTDSSSFNHNSFSFQKCSRENQQSNLFVLLGTLSVSIFRTCLLGMCLTNRFYLVILKKLMESISISGKLEKNQFKNSVAYTFKSFSTQYHTFSKPNANQLLEHEPIAQSYYRPITKPDRSKFF